MALDAEEGSEVTLEPGQGFVVYGPLRLSTLEGEVEIWGAPAEEVEVNHPDVPVLVRAVERSRVLVAGAGNVEPLQNLIPESWEEAAGSIEPGDTIVVLGGVDVGKSGLLAFLTNRLAAEGMRVALLDADIGQSDVGPPGTIGLLLVDSPLIHPKLSEPSALFFVGDVTPRGHLLPMVVGSLRLARLARERGADVTLVNTTGMIRGGAARALKRFKLAALNPTRVLLIQREGEAEHIRRLVPGGARVVDMTPPPYVSEKYSSLRRMSRRSAYARYLEGGTLRSYDLDEVGLVGTFLGSGVPKPDLLEPFSRSLGCRLLYLEEAPDAIAMLCEGRPKTGTLKLIAELTGKEVRYTTPERLRGLYLGLLSDDGLCAAVGLLERLDLESREIEVRTKYYGVPELIEFGHVRLDERYEEVGRREPWEA